MEREEAIETVKRACAEIARNLMQITPVVTSLGDQEAEKKVFETLYELTAQVETIKKVVGKIGRDDDTTLL